MFFSIARCQGGDFQDHGSDGVQTVVPDHGFAKVGTMQIQAIMPPLIYTRGSLRKAQLYRSWPDLDYVTLLGKHLSLRPRLGL